MFQKRPTWTRSKVGKGRVHWVAYDDQPGAEGCVTLAQGYAASLPEADAAARAALAEAGMFAPRRTSRGFGRRPGGPGPKGAGAEAPPRPARPKPAERPRPREYLYTRHVAEGDDWPFAAAHLVVKRTPRRTYVSRRSCGLAQLGTEDETWAEAEPTVALDRAKLLQDGAAFAKNYRQSEFAVTVDRALGEFAGRRHPAYRALKLAPPCTLDEIKAAYRLRAFEAHPDRGGTPDDFRALDAAYRRLLREAQAPEA